MADALLFDATWLYAKPNKTKLVTTLAEYEALMADGWADSPAVFGVETHPSHPIQEVSMGEGAMLQQQGMPQPFSPSQNWDDMMAMLTQMQSMLDGQAQMIAGLVDRLEVVETQLTAPDAMPAPDKGGRK